MAYYCCRMRFVFLLGMMLSFTVIAFGQSRHYTLNGFIEVSSGGVFPYKIVFRDSANYIVGYSLTFDQPEESKAAIKGRIDRSRRTLSFRETEVVYSHGHQTTAYMCLINAHLDYVQGAKGKILYGKINSTELDNTACTGGTITFDNEAEIKKLFEEPDQVDTVISFRKKTPEPVPQKPNTIAQEPPVVTSKITTGIDQSYEWHSDTVVIDVWDGGHEDGDRITLEYNGKALLTNYYLSKQRKQLRIPLSGKAVDVITIVADNEGYEPPNTADILLTDGARQYRILSYNNLGQRSLILIKRAVKDRQR